MKIMVIPDTQVKPNGITEHLKWAGQYAAEKRPDVIVHIGDHWDFPSLSSYDVGTKSFEGRRYTHDVKAGVEAMEEFLQPIRAEQQRLITNKKARWNPRLVFTLGNHEQRIERAIEKDPKLDGLIGYHDLKLEEMGWEVYGFLDVVTICGICFSHYFTSGIMGRPVSSAKLMLQKKMMSAVQGHVQDREIAYARRADGTNVTGLFAGIFYQHDEDYLTPQTNGSWSGIWMLHDVNNGSYNEQPVSLESLRRKYA